MASTRVEEQKSLFSLFAELVSFTDPFNMLRGSAITNHVRDTADATTVDCQERTPLKLVADGRVDQDAGTSFHGKSQKVGNDDA